MTPLVAATLFATLLTGSNRDGTQAPPPAAQAPLAPVRVGGPIAPPRKIKDVKPVYPVEAQQARVQGVVIVELTIGPDGKVREVAVLRSIPLSDAAAVEAARQWEFTPTLLNGVPVSVILTATVNFAMQDVPAPAAPFGPPPVRTGPPGGSHIRLAAFLGYAWEIPVERARGLPRWDPDLSPAALSTVQVASLGRTWLEQRNLGGWFVLQNIMLSRRRQGPDVDFWFYQLHFVPENASGPPSLVVILPDGSIVEPTTDASNAVVRVEYSSATDLPPGVYRAGANGVTYPRALRQVKASYTADAARAHIAGSVMLECIVLPDGSVGTVRVVRSLDAVYGLDQEAVKAAKQYQ